MVCNKQVLTNFFIKGQHACKGKSGHALWSIMYNNREIICPMHCKSTRSAPSHSIGHLVLQFYEIGCVLTWCWIVDQMRRLVWIMTGDRLSMFTLPCMRAAIWAGVRGCVTGPLPDCGAASARLAVRPIPNSRKRPCFCLLSSLSCLTPVRRWAWRNRGWSCTARDHARVVRITYFTIETISCAVWQTYAIFCWHKQQSS